MDAVRAGRNRLLLTIRPSDYRDGSSEIRCKRNSGLNGPAHVFFFSVLSLFDAVLLTLMKGDEVVEVLKKGCYLMLLFFIDRIAYNSFLHINFTHR